VATSTLDALKQLQEQTLETIVTSQKAVVDAVGEWSSSAQKLGSSFPAVPKVEGVPTAEQLLVTSFDFAQKVLDAQREFAKNLLAASGVKVEHTDV
jgi:hypothetical protein